MKRMITKLEVLVVAGFLSAGICRAQEQETEGRNSQPQGSKTRYGTVGDTHALGGDYSVRQNQDLLDQGFRYITGQPLDVVSARKQAHPLVLSEMAADSEKRAQMVEDLNIMARILNKTLMGVAGRDRSEMVMGIIVSSISDKALFQSLYLDGFGALFLLHVDFPLVPPAEEPAEETPEPATSETWERAKREMYARAPGGRYGQQLRHIVSREEKRYDAGKVERLKTDLLESLRNATHVRNLKEGDKIQVVVLSERSGSDEDGDAASESRRSAMILQVSKQDVDSFADDELNADEFIAKAGTLIY